MKRGAPRGGRLGVHEDVRVGGKGRADGHAQTICADLGVRGGWRGGRGGRGGEGRGGEGGMGKEEGNKSDRQTGRQARKQASQGGRDRK